jgi:stage II sporulation protein GA (sporulation sigma-E factor processing peptidase)
MKIAIEPILIDNTLMNFCVYLLTAAWMGIRIRLMPSLGVSLLGAVYAVLSLFLLPVLREPWLKIPCFLCLSMPLFARPGMWLKTLPFLVLSAALIGGTAMLITLQLGGSVTADGTIVGTVPVRAALVSATASLLLPQAMRRLLNVRRRHSLHTQIIVQLDTHRYRLDALIDSGNLLREPISGLPVLLIDRTVDRPQHPIPFYRISGGGVLYGERPRSVTLTEYGNAAVDCICVRSPEPIGAAQAILPENLLPYDWRIRDDRMDYSAVVAPARASAHWQTRYLMVRSHKRRAAAAARPGRGSALHRACADRSGSEG